MGTSGNVVSEDEEVHTIVVEGLAPDGKTCYADLDVAFPKGTKLTINGAGGAAGVQQTAASARMRLA